MADEQRGTIVLRDESGEYYALTPELLESARVSREQKEWLEAELERSEAGADVSGHTVTTKALGETGSPPLELIGTGGSSTGMVSAALRLYYASQWPWAGPYRPGGHRRDG